MGECAAMVHPTVKVIYETMNEFDTADIKVEGVNKLLNYPEYSDVDQLRGLLGMIEEKNPLLDVISTQTAETDNDIHIYIGTEESSGAMSKTTLIYKNVRIGDRDVSVGVIGPKRMNYSKVIGMINSLANGIDRLFNGAEERSGLPTPYYKDGKKQ
jgi:heat-inducible transcriptional repressor